MEAGIPVAVIEEMDVEDVGQGTRNRLFWQIFYHYPLARKILALAVLMDCVGFRLEAAMEVAMEQLGIDVESAVHL